MRKKLFNDNWRVQAGVKDPFAMLMSGEMGTPVMLPHDAMIAEKRAADCPNGNQTGYYPSGSYTYTKTFFVPQDWEKKTILFEFEGVMSKAMIYINEEFVTSHKNGYSQFFVNPCEYLQYGRENVIKVIAVNQEKSSRWYTGSGIYRDVNLWEGGMVSVLPEGIRITTERIEDGYAVLSVHAELINEDNKQHVVQMEVELKNREGTVVAKGYQPVTLAARGRTGSHMRLTVTEPSLWNVDTPYLYTCVCKLSEQDILWDEGVEQFGIRTLQLDARQGLRINGKPVNLRGACIHHDNGIIGAATLPGAEEYRCRKLKEAGFNAIRSAHHSMGKVMLRLCDEMGLLVMDELSDMWNVPKNANDGAMDFQEIWRDEAERMVSKDYNHPCVVLYSVGNEMPEIGRSSGRIMCREIAEELRRQDGTRYVTGGFNGFLALAGVSQEDGEAMAAAFAPPVPGDATGKNGEENNFEAKEGGKSTGSSHAEGSEKLNDVMGDIPYEIRDMLHGSEIMTKQIDEATSALDVVGLNYMPVRHLLEHELHPDHIVVGSESYPTEIVRLWKIVEHCPWVIGDFTWTGFDYLGEAGIGIYHYDCMPEGQGVYPDRLAYCGDINLNGYRRPVSYLREIVFGIRKEPFIAVERVNRYGYGCLRNHWKYDDAVDSWTFPGYEGKPARLKVLSCGDEVELILNGKSLGKKNAGKDNEYTAVYELAYEPGELTAIQYENQKETGRFTLHTAGKAACFQIEPVKTVLKADGRDVAVVELALTDEKGIPNLWEWKEVAIEVEGPVDLIGFGSADPSSEENYRENHATTYDGRLLAVLRAGNETGEAKIRFTADGIKAGEIMISMK